MENNNNEDILILVCYLDVSCIDICDIPRYVKDVIKNLGSVDGKNKLFVIPQREGETRIECINPKLVSKKEYKKASESVERLEKELNDFLKIQE